MSDDELLEKLYSVPLRDFTRERNAAAKKAPELRKLTKPKPSAWALNQLVRLERESVKAFFHAARRFQNPPGNKKLSAEEWKRTATELREHVQTLVARAESLLASSGSAASRSTSSEIETTLRAAALDEEFGKEVLQGRLAEPRFESFGLIAGPGPREEVRQPDKKAEEERRKLEAKRRELEQALKQAERTLRQAEENHQPAQAQLELAQHEHEKARAALAELDEA
jgi:hypothetical protein